MNLDIHEQIIDRKATIGVVGLGYVGLSIALAFSKVANVIGYDINKQKIEELKKGFDSTGNAEVFKPDEDSITFTSDQEKLKEIKFYIIAVPTPVTEENVPDLHFIQKATKSVAENLTKGTIVVFESTVYPGLTEEICIPILEEISGLSCGKDFKVGYSPERVNPGDIINKFENITKIVSGIDEETVDVISKIYELVIDAGIYKAKSIKVAEAAKIIENTQRDINIAFMNEVSILLNTLEIDTQQVIEAASTKWNFLRFSPGLVGGHCIGVDPYYLSYKAEKEGVYTKIISTARQINNEMNKYVVQQVIKKCIRLRMDIENIKIAILGFAYKENCSDIRNTKIKNIIDELTDYGINTIVIDPVVNQQQVFTEYGIEITSIDNLNNINVVIVAVPHQCFMEMKIVDFNEIFDNNQSKIFFDLKGAYNKSEFEHNGYHYWSL